MRPLVALLGVSVMISLAAPAHGEPNGSSDDVGFLATVRDAGLTYTDSAKAVTFGKAVCGSIEAGKSGSDVIRDLQRNNPGLTTDHATLFVGIAAKYYCPQLLTSKPASAQ
jgi:Protein of unknown function (DUF732)